MANTGSDMVDPLPKFTQRATQELRVEAGDPTPPIYSTKCSFIGFVFSPQALPRRLEE